MRSILHINTNDLRGGAAKVAWRLLTAQRFNANLLVGYKESNSRFVFPFDIKQDYARKSFCQDKGFLYYDFNGSNHLKSHPLVVEADVLHFHNLHGNYFNPWSMIQLTHMKPAIWTLHDMQAITGHCAYSYACEKWESGCGQCPDLQSYPSISTDSTDRLLADKKQIYSQSPVTIVTPSLWLKRIVERSVLKDHHVELIYNGVDTNLFIPRNKKEMRLKYGLPKNKLLIGCVANLFSDDRKGANYFEEIVRELKNRELDFLFIKIGGKNREISSPDIMSTGYINDEEVLSELYSTLDLFVFPSTADNCPLVLSEAMACGIPIVSFNTGGIPEVVRHGQTGFIAEQTNTQELIHYIYRILTNDELRLQMSMESIDQAKKYYDHDIVSNKYHDVYLQTITQFQKRQESGIKEKKIISVVRRQKAHKVAILTEGESSLNLLKKNMMAEEVELVYLKNMEEIKNCDAEFVYLYDQDYELDPYFFPVMLKGYAGEDIIACDIVLMQKGNIPFFNVIPKSMDNPLSFDFNKRASMIFRKSFFLQHKRSIINKFVCTVRNASFLYANAVKINLTKYLNRLLQKFQSGNIYIYGAGSHTEILMNHMESNYRICGIFDKNSSISGTLRYGLPVFHPSEIQELPVDCVLVSSRSYESEIYNELAKVLDRDKIITLYNRY